MTSIRNCTVTPHPSVGSSPTRPPSISDIALRIFTGATCQRDLDARVGDFISTLHAQGWTTPTIGTVTWWDPPYTGGGITIGGEDPQNIMISGWCFEDER